MLARSLVRSLTTRSFHTHARAPKREERKGPPGRGERRMSERRRGEHREKGRERQPLAEYDGKKETDRETEDEGERKGTGEGEEEKNRWERGRERRKEECPRGRESVCASDTRACARVIVCDYGCVRERGLERGSGGEEVPRREETEGRERSTGHKTD